MRIKIDDYVDAMLGSARPDLIWECIYEIERDESPLRSWLGEVEGWARTSLPTVKRCVVRPLLPEGDKSCKARFASRRGYDRNRFRGKAVVSPIVADYLEFLQGKAPKDVITRVAAALNDPESELSQTLDGACAH